MNKHILIASVFLTICFFASAGDVATFVESGFSKDGSVYVFGEYGKTDRSFESYAEIYAVDVEKNIFVQGNVFKTPPSSGTSNKSGKTTYEELSSKAYPYLKKYNCTKVPPDNLLYVRIDENKKSSDEINVKDFSVSSSDCGPISFHIALKQTVKKALNSTSSAFYIAVKCFNGTGKPSGEYTVGNPETWRKDVTSYRIDRICKDPTGTRLVFVVEKTIEDKTGTCIRYMVETIKL